MSMLVYIAVNCDNMTNVSKRKLDKKTQIHLFSQFSKLFASVDEKHSSQLFDALFTDVEKVMFIKRLAIVLMLSETYSTYAIAKTLKVSDATVRTIFKKYKIGQFDPIISVTKKKSFDSDLFWETVEILLRAGLPPRGKGRWKQAFKHLER